jgi:hypothetical protein
MASEAQGSLRQEWDRIAYQRKPGFRVIEMQILRTHVEQELEPHEGLFACDQGLLRRMPLERCIHRILLETSYARGAVSAIPALVWTPQY